MTREHDANTLSAFEQCDFSRPYPFVESGCDFLFDPASLAVVQVSREVSELAETTARLGQSEAIEALSHRYGATRISKIAGVLIELHSKGLFHRDSACTPCLIPTTIQEAYLILTDTCNLACRYCFLEGGSTAGKGKFMQPGIVKQSMEFLFSHAGPAGISLVLWGGEPLLNISQVQTVISEAVRLSDESGIPVRFATTTNCTMLTPEHATLLAKNKVVVNFSLDGAEEQHDRNRIYKNGRGTFAKIKSNLAVFLDITSRLFPEYVPRARLTLTHSTVKAFFDSHRAIWELGIPVVWTKDVDWLPGGDGELLHEDDFELLAGQYSALRDYILDRLASDAPKTVFPQIWWDLHAIHQRAGNYTACGAGSAGVSIDPEGRVFVCYHLREQGDRFQLGTVYDFDVLNPLRTKCSQRNVDSVSECRQCDFRYLCGGGCFAKGAARGHDIFACWSQQCAFIRAYQEHCIRLYARLMSSRFKESIVSLLQSREPTVAAC